MSPASLPMYDLPELRAETDRLWAALREALRARGVDAPEALERSRALQDVWTDPALVLSQTCGRPYRLGLHREVALVGAPDYGVEDCPPGFYTSAIAVRAGDPRGTLAEFAGSVCAFNGRDSQSGYAAMLSLVSGEDFFARWDESGSHLASIEAVAEGRADIAAIDAVTWRLARRHRPAARALRVLLHSAPTPGLPYITARTRDPVTVADAVEAGFARVDPADRAALGIEGFVRLTPGDYLNR